MTTQHQIPVLVPRFDPTWVYMIGTLELFHILCHYIGEQQCTSSSLFPDSTNCLELYIDSTYHFAQSLLGIGLSISYWRKDPFVLSVTLIAGLTSTYYIFCVLTQEDCLFRFTDGLQDVAGNIPRLFLPYYVCSHWMNMWDIALLLDDYCMGNVIVACLCPVGYYMGTNPNIATHQIIALGLVLKISVGVLLSGPRLSLKESLRFWCGSFSRHGPSGVGSLKSKKVLMFPF